MESTGQRVLSLAVHDWRNLPFATLGSDARFVVLHGDNGHGKTNLLEAVWVLATLRSFREVQPGRLVREGAPEARLKASVSGPSGVRLLEWRRAGAQRDLRLDGGPPASLDAWFGVIRAVLFCPEHHLVVRGGPAERRQFVDRAAFTARPGHLELVRAYERVIRQKTALLRQSHVAAAELEPWNQRLAELGARLAVRRAEIVAELSEPLRDCYRHIAGSGEVGLRMLGAAREAADGGATRGRLERELQAAQAEEIRQGRTLVGPHRDDLEIVLDGRNARAFASQGQSRSIVLALKLAELEAARRRGDCPLFLLDDLTSELDRGRMERLVEFLGQLDNQIWVTTTEPSWLGPLPGSSTRYLRVVEGAVLE